MQPHKPTASVWEQDEDRILDALGVIVSVDGIKATIHGITKEQLYAHQDLRFKFDGERDSGEIKRDRATYRGMTFTIKPYSNQLKHPGKYTIQLTGSPHKYANNGIHNADDFTYGRLLWVLNDLSLRFGIDLSLCILHNLETGVNLRLDKHWPTDILNSMLLHKKSRLQNFTIYGSDGRTMKYEQYILKAYNKGKQYPDFGGTFRFEDHFKNAEQFNEPFEIVTIEDLYHPVKLARLANRLTTFWNEVIIFDIALKQEEFLSQFDDKKQSEILRWADPDYWVALQAQTRGTKHNQYYREKIKFAEFHRQHSSMKVDVLRAIESKIAPLLALAKSPDALLWEEMTALAAETETGKIAEVGKNDRFQSPAIIAAREENTASENFTQNQQAGKNDRFGISSQTLRETEKSQQWKNQNEIKEKEGMGRNDTILNMSEFPIQKKGSDWEDELNRPEPFEIDPF